jgi:hypothetical protein
MMKRIKAYLAQKARELFRRKRYTAIRVVERVSDVPENTKDLIYIVQRGGVQQWAILNCPCRSGHKITVTLRKHDDPHWVSRGMQKPFLDQEQPRRLGLGCPRCRFEASAVDDDAGEAVNTPTVGE